MTEYVNLCKVVTMAELAQMRLVYGCATPLWTWSEKLDGMRAVWEPFSRGKMCSQIPWARIGPRGDRVATGLWSRLGNPIYAPDWWLDRMPLCVTDGELWMGYEHREELMEIVKLGLDGGLAAQSRPGWGHGGSGGWNRVRHWVYGDPGMEFFRDRTFRDGKVRVRVCHPGHTGWKPSSVPPLVPGLDLVEQHVGLPTEADMDAIFARGGEGVVLRRVGWKWKGVRDGWFKVKPFTEEWGTVVGTKDGLGRFSGMIGSLRVVLDSGVECNVTGLNYSERRGEWIGRRVKVRFRNQTRGGAIGEGRYCRRIGE